ncbi:hydrogenase nickel incorporation protein HypB [Oscillatoriales cyanobacterium LEGE 11467]|uniref:Hydrogenase nickel incorporation protein HypB n=1 Tax=Zarconia navalis LEGE 11467 TaxID=1828826 RepID=A0A928VWA2_9CYAN|nr:hydrogenase nickel incorporation protein HypB [Zarconia navalis]MBE9041316.1 hydrogenase nickel incorporation protein HypB [Zarconia navalis LEGE 11467]
MYSTLSDALESAGTDNPRGGADRNRAQFDRWGITCLALIGSPSVGTTVLLERTLASLKNQLEVAAIAGGTLSEIEADRLRLQGVPVLAARADISSHLNSQTIAEGLRQFEHQYTPSNFDLVWVERALDLVDPDGMAVGEHLKVALLEVTGGEDRLLEYAAVLREAHCILLTKIDLVCDVDLNGVEINIERLMTNVRQIAPNTTILPISTKTGAGFEAWLNWIRLQVALRSQSDKAARHEMAAVGNLSGSKSTQR